MFTAITITATLLSSLTGTLRGLLPIFILLVSAYPYYVEVWDGIMKDQVQERLFAWRYIALELAYLITTLSYCVLSAALQLVALEADILGIIASYLIRFLMIIAIFLLAGHLLTDRINRAVHKIFAQSLPSAKAQLTNKEVETTAHRHVRCAPIFLAATTIVEVLTIQEWLLATGILKTYAVPYTLQGAIFAIAPLFVTVWLCSLIFFIPTEAEKTKKQ